LHAEAFAAQVFGPFDFRPGDHCVSKLVGERSNQPEIGATGGCAQHRRGAGVGELGGAGAYGRHLNRPRANKDDIRVDAVLGKQTLLLRDPERSLSGVYPGKGDDNFGRRSRSV
jgi:hypothetical protein